MEYKVLAADDETELLDALELYTERENIRLIKADNGITALELFRKEKPNLVLLDIMMPGLDGFAVLKKIRAESKVPAIMLTARGEDYDKILGLELGADDYITKPFSMRELMARIHANLRRTVSEPQPPVQQASSADLVCGEIEVFFDAHEIRCRGKVLDLTAREYEILRYMASNANRVIPREELMEKV